MIKTCKVLFIFFLLAATAVAQTSVPGSTTPFQLPGLDLNFSGGGARARGMGGAFLGVSGDLSAVGFNPAGLAGLDRTQTALVYRYSRPGVRSRQFLGGSTSASIDYKNIDSFDQIDFGAVAAPGKFFNHTFVGTAAYLVFADQFYADQASFMVPIDTNNTPANFAASRQTIGKLAGFNLGVATRFNRFSFGANFQIYQGGFSDTSDFIIGPFSFTRPGSSAPEQAVVRQRFANKTSYRGSSLVLGAQGEYKKGRLGVAARIPSFKLGDTDVFRLKSNMDIGIYDSTFLSGLPYPPAVDGQLYLTDSWLELPLSLSAGVSYLFGSSLLVNADYSYTNWGAADLKVRRVFQAPYSNLAALSLGSAPVSLTSTHQVRIGWEYGLDTRLGQLALRGGVRNIPVRTLTSLLPFTYQPVFRDSFVVDDQGNVVDTISTAQLFYLGAAEDPSANGFGASAGLGVRWNQVALDLAYDYSTYLRSSRTQTPFQGQQVVLHRQRQHRVFVGFTGYFTRL